MQQKQLTLFQRWNGPTSPFFAPVVKYGYILMAVCGAIAGFPDQFSAIGLPVPELLTKVAETAAWVSGALATLAKFTVADPAAYLKELAKRDALKDL